MRKFYNHQYDDKKPVRPKPPSKLKHVAQAMVDLKLEGQWRVHQTACGLLISFMREDDLLIFQHLDLSNVLGLPASAFGFSSLETYRQVSTTNRLH